MISKKLQALRLPIAGLILSLTLSCTTQKNLTYLQDPDETETEKVYPFMQPEYKLQKQDLLYVDISSSNAEMTALIEGSQVGGSQNMNLQAGSGYLMGYSIDEAGCIEIPALGKVEVLGKTMDEATQAIKTRSLEVLKDSRVSVKLLSFQITVLGEVNIPGSFTNYKKQLTILEAIGMAGDITVYGNRGSVLVLRSKPEGTVTYRVNLKNRNLLSSEAYYLLPNDLVIVEPMKTKFLSVNSPTISLLFTTVSMAILITNFVK